MAIEKGKLQLERFQFDQFMKLFKTGNFIGNKKYGKKLTGPYHGQRLGQAFYNHFKLHRLVNQTQLKGLYELDGDAAMKVIKEVFKFN